jgi:hypothetical protein
MKSSPESIVTPKRTGLVGSGLALVSWAMDKLFPNLPNIVPLAVLGLGVVLIVFAFIRAIMDRKKDTEQSGAQLQFDRIRALATDRLHCITGRIKYAEDAKNGRKDPSVWYEKLSKKKTQGVRFEALKDADTELLTLKQKTAYQRCLGQLEELEQFINSVIENPSGYNPGATTPYLHRASIAKDALENLISELGGSVTPIAAPNHETEVEEDTPLGEAMAYMVTGRWGLAIKEVLREAFEAKPPDPFESFRRAAHRQKVRCWGRLDPDKLVRKIPTDHWSEHQVDAKALLMNDFARTWGHDGESYVDLMVNRAEIEREFPDDG